MAVFFPKEVWALIIDYTPIYRNMHRKRLKTVLEDQRACYEAMFDLLFTRSAIWRPELPVELKLDYLENDCVALSRETLANTTFVSMNFVAEHVNDYDDAWERLLETDMYVFDAQEGRTYVPVEAGIMMLPFYRRAKPMDLWAKDADSLYRVRWALDYIAV